jgi:hypothetical protein
MRKFDPGLKMGEFLVLVIILAVILAGLLYVGS